MKGEVDLRVQETNSESSSSIPTESTPIDTDTDTITADPEPEGTALVESETAPEFALDQLLDAVDLSRLSFELGTAQLTPAGKAATAELASQILLDPNEPVPILVRTFSESTPGQNHGLSVQQAETIRDSPTNSGIDPSRLQIVAHGDPHHFAAPGRAGAITTAII